MQICRINAKDFIGDAQSVVGSAAVVAKVVSERLQTGDDVVLSVRGMRGVSSSFFNVVLAAAIRSMNGQFDQTRFHVETDTETQRMVYERSLRAFAEVKPT